MELLLFNSPAGLDVSQLSYVYRESLEKDSFGYRRFDQPLQDFEDYWRNAFFSLPGASCAVLELDGRYMSVLRLEPYRDGLLITGLETVPECRSKGMATNLLSDVIRHLKTAGGGRLYSHIERRNKPSVCVHKSCGFCLLFDYAVFLDGSVCQNYDTYVLDI